MQKTKTNPLIYIMAAVGLLAVVGVVVVLMSNSRSKASPTSESVSYVNITVESGAYSAHAVGYESPVENWRYVVRNDDTCDSSVFTNGGRESEGNLAAVVYGSDTFTPTEQQKTDYEGQYICFRALLENGDWVSGQELLGWSWDTENDDRVVGGNDIELADIYPPGEHPADVEYVDAAVNEVNAIHEDAVSVFQSISQNGCTDREDWFNIAELLTREADLHERLLTDVIDDSDFDVSLEARQQAAREVLQLQTTNENDLNTRYDADAIISAFETPCD